jgi:hypothetical protein
MNKQDIHRTPRHERTQLEQDFRDKAANHFRISRKCDNTYSEALYLGQYIANKWAAVSVRTAHRYGHMQDMTEEPCPLTAEAKDESYAKKLMRGYDALEELNKVSL